MIRVLDVPNYFYFVWWSRLAGRSRANQKAFIFRQGNCTMNVLHSSLSKSFAFSICFARLRTAKCIASCNHDGFMEDDYCVSFFKLKFLIPTLGHISSAHKGLQIFTEKVTSKVPFREVGLKNIDFCGLK